MTSIILIAEVFSRGYSSCVTNIPRQPNAVVAKFARMDRGSGRDPSWLPLPRQEPEELWGGRDVVVVVAVVCRGDDDDDESEEGEAGESSRGKGWQGEAV